MRKPYLPASHLLLAMPPACRSVSLVMAQGAMSARAPEVPRVHHAARRCGGLGGRSARRAIGADAANRRAHGYPCKRFRGKYAMRWLGTTRSSRPTFLLTQPAKRGAVFASFPLARCAAR